MTAVALAFFALALALREPGALAWVVPAGGGAIALLSGFPRTEQAGATVSVVIAMVGVAAFVLARSFWTATPPTTSLGVVASVASAVGEEAIFRHWLYGVLQRWGPLVAVCGSALAFAAVHVAHYGWWAIPVDVGAGVIFGWQRWATGRWEVPAVTHALANIVQAMR